MKVAQQCKAEKDSSETLPKQSQKCLKQKSFLLAFRVALSALKHEKYFP